MLCVATLVAGTVHKLKLQQELSSMSYDVSECASATSFALGLAWCYSLLILVNKYKDVLAATAGRLTFERTSRR